MTEAETDIGGVDALRFTVTSVHRRVSVADDMVRLRDRDSNGRLLADIGYSAHRARHLARLLILAAQHLDPAGHVGVLDDLPRDAVPVRTLVAVKNGEG